MIAQKTPDAGQTSFWYDRLGRLVLSQNNMKTGDEFKIIRGTSVGTQPLRLRADLGDCIRVLFQ